MTSRQDESEDSQRLGWVGNPRRELARLSWPIAISMTSYALMTLTDTLFVGRLGANALAGVGLGGTAVFTVLCFVLGTLRGVKVKVSHAVGARRRGDVPGYLWAGWAIAAVASAAVLLLRPLLQDSLSLVAGTAEVGAQAGLYFGIRILSAPLVFGAVVVRELRYGTGDSRGPMAATIVANVVNVGADYALIFGFGLGVAGAAWATVLANLAQFGILVGIQWKDIRGFYCSGREHILGVWSVGYPLGMQFLLEVGSFMVLALMIASLSAVEMGAHQIAMQVIHLSFLPAFAVAEAASVMVGQSAGAGRVGLIIPIARLGLKAGSAYTGVCSVILAVAARPIAMAFTSDPLLVETTVHLLWVAAVFQVADGANVVARGALRGTGDVRIPALISIGIAWFCTPTLMWLLGYRLGLGALGGWLGLCLEITVGAGVLWWRLERAHWLPAARREARQLRARAVASAA